MSRHRAVPVLLLLVVILAGSYIRLVELGTPSFRSDEIQHYHAAQSLQEGLGPLNQAGETYERGIDITRLVALTDKIATPPERAARLPAAGFGVVNLLLIAVVGWIMGGPWAAFWATTLLAIYPEAIWQSRQVRFYTYQLTFGLIALGTGWIAFQTWKRGNGSGWKTWVWLGLTVVAFLLAARVQIVTLSTMAGWIAFLAVAAVGSHVLKPRLPWRDNIPLQATVLALFIGAGALVLRPEIVPRLIETAMTVPSWVGAPGHRLTYYYALISGFPLLVSLAPVAAGVVFLRKPWLAFYLLTWFLVPFVVLSLVFPFRQERFILTAVPGLFLLGGIAASLACGGIHAALEGRLRGTSPGFLRWKAVVPPVAVVIVACGALFTTPAFNVARKMPDPTSWPDLRREDWRATVGFVEKVTSAGAVALGTSDPMASTHYWGRVDFQVAARGHAPGEVSGPAAVAVWADPEGIVGRFSEYDRVLIGLDSTRIRAGRIHDNLLRVLREQGQELCEGRCGTIMLYVWQLPKSGSEPQSTLEERSNPSESDPERVLSPVAPF